jgi:hypothetical protein
VTHDSLVASRTRLTSRRVWYVLSLLVMFLANRSWTRRP